MCKMLGDKVTWLVVVVVLSVSTRSCVSLHKQDGHLEAARGWLSLKGSRWWSLYMPSSVNETSECGQAIMAMRHSLALKHTWALKMVDSWGKSVDGIMYGTRAAVGVFDECISSKSPDKSIHGKYCTIVLRREAVSDGLDTKDNPSWIRGQNLHMMPFVLDYNWQLNGSLFKYGTCMPDACSTEDLQESLVETYSNTATNYVVNSVSCQPNDSQNKFSAGDIVFITLLGVLFFTMLVAGIIDAYIEKTNNKAIIKGGLRYLLPFSVYTNVRKLFHLNTDHSPGTITCLHGIKVLSMTWVVFGHQQFSTLVLDANTIGMWSKVNGFLYQVAANAYVSVDTFFFIGGLLLSFSVLKQLKKTGSFNIIVFYLHRIVRLVPSIGLVAGLFATVVHFFVSGPIADEWKIMQRTCQLTWWRDILFIDNFVMDPVEPGSLGDCLGQCWYLAVDTQFYLVSPLLLLPLYFYRAAGEVMLYLLGLASVIIPASIIYANDLAPSNLFLDPKAEEFMRKVYTRPWCRAGPWLVGVWLGHVFYTRGNNTTTLTKWQVVAGWTLAAVAGSLVLFGMWSYNTVPQKAQYDVMTQVVYGGCQRITWGAVMAWVVFACHNGYGGLVNEFLSHPVWQPLGRLTFCMYLVAFPLQFVITFNTRVPYYYNCLNKIMETVGVLVISGAIATLVSLSVEAPVIGLEKILLGRPDSRRNDPARRRPNTEDKLSENNGTGHGTESKLSGHGTESKLSGNGTESKLSGNGTESKLSGNGTESKLSGNGTESKLSGNGTESKLSGNGTESKLSGHDNYSFIDEMIELTDGNDTRSEHEAVENVSKL